jgi:hypothetical protein
MNLMGVPNTFRYMATGGVFILAILLNKLIRGERILNIRF